MRRAALAVVALIFVLASIASPAGADVDLSGDWVVEYDLTSFGGGVAVDDAVLGQSGTTLSFTDVAYGAMTGSIDPATGAFHVEGMPTQPPIPMFPAGPPIERDATAGVDGARFRGHLTQWALAPHAFWLPFEFPMIGARAGIIVCGDGIRDPGEQCDDGGLNGSDQCCDASCAFVDANQSGLCGGDGSFVASRFHLSANGAVPDTSRIAVQGMLQGAGVDVIMDIPSFRVRDGDLNDKTVSDLVCTRKKTTLTCVGPNKRSQLKLSTSKRGTKLTFKMKQASLSRALSGPVTVAFVDDHGIQRTAIASTCKTTANVVLCTP